MPPIREGPYDVFVILHGADGVVEVLVKVTILQKRAA